MNRTNAEWQDLIDRIMADKGRGAKYSPTLRNYNYLFKARGYLSNKQKEYIEKAAITLELVKPNV